MGLKVGHLCTFGFLHPHCLLSVEKVGKLTARLEAFRHCFSLAAPNMTSVMALTVWEEKPPFRLVRMKDNFLLAP